MSFWSPTDYSRELKELKQMLEHNHTLIHQLLNEVHTMSASLDRLTAEVAETNAVIDSAITLINGLAQAIRDAATDPAALEALATELDTKANELAGAVAANTPTP